VAKTEATQQAKPDLSEQAKVKEMFVFAEKIKMESMQTLQLMMQQNMHFNFAMEAMIMQSYMQDRLFLEYGVEEDDLMAAVVCL
jgi:hypothetical protein